MNRFRRALDRPVVRPVVPVRRCARVLRLLRPLVLLAAALLAGGAAPAGAAPPAGGPSQGTGPGVPGRSVAATARFQVGLIGDLLYTDEELAKWPNLMAALDAAPLAFVVHDGDFKSGSSRCDDAVFEDRLRRFQASAHPFVYVPGDNEWTDCHRENNGAYDPLERLAKLRGMFFPGNQSLGRRTLRLERQSDDSGYAAYRENARWVHGNVLFLTLNVQGSNNNLGRTPAADAEYLERNVANLVWLRTSFDLARRRGIAGAMVVIQANPGFELPRDHPERTGFNDFLGALEEEILAFDRPVALVHGDSHSFQINKPLFAASTRRRVEHFTRVETFGTPDSHWIRATIDPTDPAVFRFDPVLVPANLVDHRR